MTDFQNFDETNAPGQSGEHLSKVREKMGFVPNLYGFFAVSDVTLEAYLTLSKLVSKTSFSPGEQQLILLIASIENNCSYCVAAHSSGARMAKLDKPIIEAVRSGHALDDPKLQALRVFVEAIVTKNGYAKPEMQAFLDAGFSQKQVMETLVCVAMKTLSNYANHLVDVPLDDVLQRMAWQGKQ